MSIWFELMALSLAAYAVGLLLGWIIWGNIAQTPADDPAQNSGHPANNTATSEPSEGKTEPTT